jgi:hypothetical protein
VDREFLDPRERFLKLRRLLSKEAAESFCEMLRTRGRAVEIERMTLAVLLRARPISELPKMRGVVFPPVEKAEPLEGNVLKLQDFFDDPIPPLCEVPVAGAAKGVGEGLTKSSVCPTLGEKCSLSEFRREERKRFYFVDPARYYGLQNTFCAWDGVGPVDALRSGI